MPIPKEILAVDRPKNTVVCAYGKDKTKYSVRARIGCRYDNGRRIPQTGSTIGHIIDGMYVPVSSESPQRVSLSAVDLKDWAGIQLCDSLFSGMIDELRDVYEEKDALAIYCIAVLRACYPGINDCELKEAYDTCFLSEIYPGVALSRNTVSALLNNIGKACSRILSFMRKRTSRICEDHHLLVDGTLKSNDSSVNSLSDFSRKTKTRGRRDISVLFAFDLESMEPVCSQCFPGNMLDVTAYEAFLKANGIKSGMVVADKGFPSSAAEQHFRNNPELHYLNPIKRNAKAIKTYSLRDYEGMLPGYDGITYKKAKCVRSDKWLYSYRDTRQAAMEERDWLNRAKARGDYSNEKLLDKQASFGTLVLESDQDLPPETAYKAYNCRWEIEIVMRFYKSACEFDVTRVQDDYSVIASEFCDFLSTVLTFRIIKKFDQCCLLDNMTYKKIMSILRRAKKVRIEGGAWEIIKISPSHMDILQKLNLVSQAADAPKRKRGRPKKNHV